MSERFLNVGQASSLSIMGRRCERGQAWKPVLLYGTTIEKGLT